MCSNCIPEQPDKIFPAPALPSAQFSVKSWRAKLYTCCASSLVGRTTRARTWQTTRSSRTCQNRGQISPWKPWGEKELLVSKLVRRDGRDTFQSSMFPFYSPPYSQLLILRLLSAKRSRMLWWRILLLQLLQTALSKVSICIHKFLGFLTHF